MATTGCAWSWSVEVENLATLTISLSLPKRIKNVGHFIPSRQKGTP
jgi:hypothetical protein